MGAIDKLLSIVAPNTFRRIEKESRSRSEPITQEELAGYFGATSWSNIDVDRIAMMGLPIVWACLKVLGESLASFPLILYEGKEEGATRRIATGHHLYNLLHDMPNPQQDAFTFKEQAMGHLGIYGNFYANIVRMGSGYVKELWPLNPDKVTPMRENGELLYKVVTNGVQNILGASEVFHVRGFSFDGVRGYAPLELQSQTYALAIAAKRYASEFFANNGTPDLAFLHKQRLNKDTQARLRDSWKENHAQWGKKHSPLILEEGMDVKELSSNPENAQLIETNKFIISEVCRVYRMPPHLVQDLDRSTNNNIEEQGIDFSRHTMRPWCMRWESAISQQLLSDKDRKRFYAEFNMDAILRGNTLTRAQVYNTQIGCGMLSPNEARRKEQWNDRERGDIYYVPLNWVDATKPPEPKVEKIPTETQPETDEQPIEEPVAKRSIETRTIRSAKARKKISNSFGKLISDSVARVVRKEKRDVSKAVSDQLKRRDIASFNAWLDKYYRDLPDYIVSQIAPVFQAFSASIRTEIANELGIDDISQMDDRASKSYVDMFAKRYVDTSRGGLANIVKSGLMDSEAEDIEKKLDEWQDNRAEKVSEHEKVFAAAFIAMNTYRSAGISKVTWVAEPDSCEMCQDKDGKQFDVDGNMQPPLHGGCGCQIMAAG